MSINANGVDIVWQAVSLLNHRWLTRCSLSQPVVDIFKFQQPGLNETTVCMPVLKRFRISRFKAATNDHYFNDCYLPVIKLFETATDNVREIEC